MYRLKNSELNDDDDDDEDEGEKKIGILVNSYGRDNHIRRRRINVKNMYKYIDKNPLTYNSFIFLCV